MGIRSESFRGVVISGQRDIEKFDQQVKRSRPNKAAVTTAATGKKLATEFQKKGYATVTTRSAAKRSGRGR